MPTSFTATDYLPAPTGDRLRDLARLAALASTIAAELERDVAAAHRAGYSWSRITPAIAGRWPNGSPAALGDLFPGGLSVTTVRRWAGL